MGIPPRPDIFARTLVTLAESYRWAVRYISIMSEISQGAFGESWLMYNALTTVFESAPTYG